MKNLATKNDLSANVPSKEQKSHLIYEFKCQEGECKSQNSSYIGMTSCTLRERMVGHKYKGSIFKHYWYAHHRNPELEELISNSKILYQPEDTKKLAIFEAIFIRENKPTLNENVTDFTCLSLNIF